MGLLVSSSAFGASSLRMLAEKKGITIGAAVGLPQVTDDAKYKEVVAREFNVVTPENAFKFAATQKGLNTFDFSQADQIVEAAKKMDQKIRGHNLVWHHSLPDWLTKGRFSNIQKKEILRFHIQSVLNHFRSTAQGRIIAWDVVNEAITDDGKLRSSFWQNPETSPDEYITLAFQWAHQADPTVKLFYNDYSAEGINKKSDAIYHMIVNLKDRGVPIDGIGSQFHLDLKDPPDFASVKKNMQRFAALGLEIHITEMDVEMDLKKVNKATLEAQGKIYGNALRTCLGVPECKSFVSWGFTDKYSWIPSFHSGFGSALLYDEAFEPKPAYQALVKVLEQEG